MLVNVIKRHCSKHSDDIGKQLDSVWIPLQMISGSESDFSFMAYPLPRLTPEERNSMELTGADRIVISESKISIRIDLDDFGKINWFYITGMPETFGEITCALSRKR